MGKSVEKWLKVGKSGEKVGESAESWKKLEKVGKSREKGGKVGKVGKSGEKWRKVVKSGPFQIHMDLNSFLKNWTKWPPAAILDVRK